MQKIQPSTPITPTRTLPARSASVVVITMLLILAALILRSSLTTIKPGEVGIIVNTAGSQREITRSDIKVGRVFFNPITTDVIRYPVTTSRVVWDQNDSITFQSREGMAVNTDVAFAIRIDPDAVPALYTKYRKSANELIAGIVRDMVRDKITDVGSNYAAVELIGPGRSRFQAAVNQAVQSRLQREGIIIENFALIGEIRVPDEVRQALNRSNAATQAAIQAENELRKTQAEGRKKVAEAQAEAQAAKAKAEGEAQAILARAEAQAKANRILAQSLTPELVKYKQIEKWDGKMPTVQAGDRGNLLLNVNP